MVCVGGALSPSLTPSVSGTPRGGWSEHTESGQTNIPRAGERTRYVRPRHLCKVMEANITCPIRGLIIRQGWSIRGAWVSCASLPRSVWGMHPYARGAEVLYLSVYMLIGVNEWRG